MNSQSFHAARRSEAALHGRHIYLHHYEPLVEVLGPGRKFVIWTQGCPFHCSGCIAPGTQSDQGGAHIAVTELADEIVRRADNLEGVTLSGGEPFLQPAPLAALIDQVRARASHLSLMIFSGHKIETLRARKDAATDRLLAQTDILVDGVFIENRPSPSLWRGSANQRIWYLTNRYGPEDERVAKRSLEFFPKIKGQMHQKEKL